MRLRLRFPREEAFSPLPESESVQAAEISLHGLLDPRNVVIRAPDRVRIRARYANEPESLSPEESAAEPIESLTTDGGKEEE